MTWTAWRLTRSTAIATAVLAIVAVGYLLWSGNQVRGSFTSTGLADCLVGGHLRPNCSDAALTFYQLTRTMSGGQPVVGVLSLMPGLIGSFIGAPLVAREIETGTLRLAWTQSVTRKRWLTTRSLVALLVVVLGVSVMTAGLTYWRWPLDQVDGRVEVNGYDVQGVIPVAYAICAFSLGLAFGLLTRRVVPAIAVSLAVFFLLRTVIETVVRPRLLSPVVLSFTGKPPADLDTRLTGAWILNERLPRPGTGFPTEYTFQPADHFWPLQLLETGILLAISAAALGFAYYWIGRRTH
jgi:hypothetical protein